MRPAAARVLRWGSVRCPRFTLATFSVLIDTLCLTIQEGGLSRAIHCVGGTLSHHLNQILTRAEIKISH